jgi:hypothetical protein
VARIRFTWGRPATLIWKVSEEMPPKTFSQPRLPVIHEQCAGWTAQRVKLCARDGRPPAFPAEFGKTFCIAGKELVRCRHARVRDVAQRMDADLELIESMAGTLAGFAVEIDQWTEAAPFAPDDGDHQGQPQRSGPNEGSRGSADSQPDWQRILLRTRIHSLSSQRGSVFSRPVDMGVYADFQKQSSFSAKMES